MTDEIEQERRRAPREQAGAGEPTTHEDPASLVESMPGATREPSPRIAEPGILKPVLRRTLLGAIPLGLLAPLVSVLNGHGLRDAPMLCIFGFLSGIGIAPLALIEILAARRPASIARDLLAGAASLGVAAVVVLLAFMQLMYSWSAVVEGKGMQAGWDRVADVITDVFREPIVILVVLLSAAIPVLPLCVLRLRRVRLVLQIVGTTSISLVAGLSMLAALHDGPPVAEFGVYLTIVSPILVLSFWLADVFEQYLGRRALA